MLPQPPKNIVIDTDRKALEPALDYAFLRTRGIELIQQFAGSNWSDFNLHDPGVTILEYLCYALTDVAYRTTFPIADILAGPNGLIDREANFFFPKEEVLSSGAVTPGDYRKLLIDSIPELGNVWLEPVTSSYTATHSKGIYKVIIEPAAQTGNIYSEEQLVRAVKEKLQANRNIGEHFECFRVLQPQPVYIKAEVIIEKNAFPEGVLASIYEAVAQTVNPTVTRYAEAELQGQGYAIEEIYAGPLLENGIIPDSSLKPRIKELDPFVLVKAISGIKGVTGVKKLLLSIDDAHYHSEVLQFDDRHFPLVIIDDTHPDIILYNDNFPLYIRKPDVLKKEHGINRKLKTAGVQKRTAASLHGVYKGLQEYISIQTLFPAIYGISEAVVPGGRPAARVAQSRQLKAFLMFFEQVLANSLSQLANISQLFSTDTSGAGATYYAQPLYSVPDAKYILKAFTAENPGVSTVDWERFKSDAENAFIRALHKFIETDEQYKDRKKRVFDHLLARFNIALDKHPVYLYEFYYDRENAEKRIDLEIAWKAAILQHLTVFTGNRMKAENYFALHDDENTENGFRKKMSLLLHIRNGARRRLSEVPGRLSRQLLLAEAGKENDVAAEPVTVSWKEEVLDILPGVSEDSLTGHITFRGQTEQLFQSAIELNNYRMVPARLTATGEQVLLFKHAADTGWSRISKHGSEYEAVRALKNTVRFFKELSIESEGFYVLEHLLLKPSVTAPQYGFTFAGTANNLLIQQWQAQPFEEREATVNELLTIAANYSNDNYETTANRLQDLCVFYNNPFLSQQPAFVRPGKEAIEHLIDNLVQFARRPTDFYPSFAYTVQLTDGATIAEDFFSFRMTIVLPSWPARFQDKGFREMAEVMFREECPAHMRVSFLWLSLAQLKIFDGLYFNWLHALQTDPDSAGTRSHAQDLIRFLITNGAPWHGNV